MLCRAWRIFTWSCSLSCISTNIVVYKIIEWASRAWTDRRYAPPRLPSLFSLVPCIYSHIWGHLTNISAQMSQIYQNINSLTSFSGDRRLVSLRLGPSCGLARSGGRNRSSHRASRIHVDLIWASKLRGRIIRERAWLSVECQLSCFYAPRLRTAGYRTCWVPWLLSWIPPYGCAQIVSCSNQSNVQKIQENQIYLRMNLNKILCLTQARERQVRRQPRWGASSFFFLATIASSI